MRSGIVIVALAAAVMAVPYKRDLVTDVEMVYMTDVVTVTATEGQAAASPAVVANAAAAPSPETTSTSSQAGHYGHHWTKTWQFTSQAEPSTTSTTSIAPAFTAPTTSAIPTTSVIPIPTSTTSTAPAFSAPTTTVIPIPTTSPSSTSTTSTTSVWVAPTTSTAAVWSAATSMASAIVSSAASAAPTDYAGIAVLHHNLHRANHSADPVAWSADLAKSASDIAASCVYAHNTDMDGGGYGQNIAAGVEGTNISLIITDLFYNGEVNWFDGLYGQAQPDMTNFEHWGHFSQIVWKDTKFIGCATQYCPNGLGNVGSDVAPYFTVCNYKGPGNYANEYGSNIGAPLNKPTADWNTGLSS